MIQHLRFTTDPTNPAHTRVTTVDGVLLGRLLTLPNARVRLVLRGAVLGELPQFAGQDAAIRFLSANLNRVLVGLAGLDAEHARQEREQDAAVAALFDPPHQTC